MPVAPAAGQLRYTRLPTSDGEIADYPSAFFLVEELSASRFIIARPWLAEDAEEDIISPVELPDVPGQQLAYEVLDLTGLKSRMTPLPESVLFDFSDERKPNPFTLAALVEHIPEGLRNSASVRTQHHSLAFEFGPAQLAQPEEARAQHFAGAALVKVVAQIHLSQLQHLASAYKHARESIPAGVLDVRRHEPHVRRPHVTDQALRDLALLPHRE